MAGSETIYCCTLNDKTTEDGAHQGVHCRVIVDGRRCSHAHAVGCGDSHHRHVIHLQVDLRLRFRMSFGQEGCDPLIRLPPSHDPHPYRRLPSDILCRRSSREGKFHKLRKHDAVVPAPSSSKRPSRIPSSANRQCHQGLDWRSPIDLERHGPSWLPAPHVGNTRRIGTRFAAPPTGRHGRTSAAYIGEPHGEIATSTSRWHFPWAPPTALMLHLLLLSRIPLCISNLPHTIGGRSRDSGTPIS